MATGPALNLSITRKQFAGTDAPLFADLHLDIAPQSVVALIGPSGVGKSTLLRLIAGIDTAFTGSITIADAPAAAAPPPGFVFQDPRLLPWLTALGNVMAASPTIDAQAARSALAHVGLAEAVALYPHQLSGGMQRRVALARAIAVNAGLLLLDEPFVSLDRVLLDQMQQQVIALIAATRPTVVFVSHLVDDAARLADRAILLGGRPANILADLALPVPPLQRDETILARYRAMITAAGEAPYST
ncbi:MAG: ABC transporter ATP-binding protein [Alphaproteobacteria bacterium]|nr:ABC transporter ATP-binding protein [Alphaproteobacteria bacterium]